MTTDAWAAAQATPASTAPAGESQIADSYEDQESQLFSGGEGAGPSIINKTHPVGTVRTGIIAKPPYDRQSTNTKGELKYWQDGAGNKPVTDAVNPATGKANRPVMDTVIVLDTEYVMDQAEATRINRETPYEGGQRSFTAGGENLKLLKKAVETYNGNPNNFGRTITGGKSMVGLRFTIKRVGEKPNPNGGDTIKIHEIVISQP